MLSIDYANCLSERVGEHGLDAASLGDGSASAGRAAEITGVLEGRRGEGAERWRQLPADPLRFEHTGAVLTMASDLRGKFDNIVVLGIGGSALGNIALHAALRPPTWNLLPTGTRGGPRLFVLDNVDPALVAPTLRYVAASSGGMERTLINVISKSGETAETAAQFLIARRMLIDALGEGNHARNIVAITDPSKGTMREICDREGYRTLPVPEGVGGRFSVLSPVGLFSAAMCGIDIDAVLDGAADMDRRCSTPNLRDNPAAMLATLLVRLAQERGKRTHVLMPYSNSLYLLADWFRQLWAESLGKRFDLGGDEVFAGFTPVKALGATDQHSQVQLYREGPNDKVIGFVEVEDAGSDNLAIPDDAGAKALSYLRGASLGSLLRAEKRATEYALVESARPNFTVRFGRLDAHHVGQFIQLWQVTTAYAGLLLGVDAYDQPAVELGKQATFGLMGREGFESFRERVDGALGSTDRVV